MSPLWPDFALARVAWAKAEADGSVLGGKAKLSAAGMPTTASRPVRRVHQSWLSNSFAR
jgi:hypothetical protein